MKQLLKTPIFEVVELEEALPGFRPVSVVAPDWVSVIAEKDGKFLMVRQMRYGLGMEFEEFPCGMVEENEFPNKAAARELAEETGIRLTHDASLHYLGRFAANPAFMTNYMHYYHVNLDYAPYTTGETAFDEHERLTSAWVEKCKAYDDFVRSEGSAIMGCAWMLLARNGIIKA